MVADAAASDATTRRAVRFFWVWLILATSVSVGGNVAHAVLTAPTATLRLAAAAAVVPPAVLLGSTHSVSLLVRTRRVGFTYWCALAMTIALAVCAFVLSFDALRDLAVTLGMLPDRAWLWPVAIDVSIANSTLSLLSLAPPPMHPAAPDRLGDTEYRLLAETPPRAEPDGRSSATDPAPTAPGPIGGYLRPVRNGQTDGGSQRTNPPVVQPGSSAAVEAALASIPATAVRPEHAAVHDQWRPAADELVRNGVTAKDPAVVAAVLADHAAGTAPSTIARRHDVHYSIVKRILAAAAGLTDVSGELQPC